MAITFQQKRQKYLLQIFLGLLLVIFLIIYFGFFKKEKKPPLGFFYKPPSIKINFDILESEKFKNLVPIPKIKALDREKIKGREFPFSPY